MVTIDGLIMGRSAAWLCAAEQQSGRSSAQCGVRSWRSRGAARRRGRRGAKAASPRRRRSRPSAELGLALPHAAGARGVPLVSKPEHRLYAALVFEAYRGAEDEYGQSAQVGPKLYPTERRAELLDFGTSMNWYAYHRGPISESFHRDAIEASVKLIRQLAATHPAEMKVQALLEKRAGF